MLGSTGYRKPTGRRAKPSKPANREPTTTILKEPMHRAWLEFKALDGMKTSQMNDRQLRLVELFTARRQEGLVWKRKVDNYIFPTLVHLGITSSLGTNALEYRVDITEDKEVYFPPQPSTTNIIDVSFYSLDAETYVPTRSRQAEDKQYERICYSATVGIYIPGTPGTGFRKREDPFSSLDTDKLPKKLSECTESQINILYAKVLAKEAHFTGDAFIVDGFTVVEVDQQLLPTKTATTAEITLRLLGELTFYSRTPQCKAPRYIRAALGYYHEHGDELLDEAISYLGGLGKSNIGEIDVVKNTRGINSKTLQIATEFLYYDYGRIKFSS